MTAEGWPWETNGADFLMFDAQCPTYARATREAACFRIARTTTLDLSGSSRRNRQKSQGEAEPPVLRCSPMIFDAFPRMSDSTHSQHQQSSDVDAFWVILGRFGQGFSDLTPTFKDLRLPTDPYPIHSTDRRTESTMASTCRLNSGTSERTSWSLWGGPKVQGRFHL